MIYNQLLNIAEQYGKNPALTEGNTILPFGNLVKLIDRSAQNLINSGIDSNKTVMIIGRNSIQLMALFFALAKNGNRTTIIDPNSTKEEIEDLTKTAKCDVILYQSPFNKVIPISFRNEMSIQSSVLDEFYFTGSEIKKPSFWKGLFPFSTKKTNESAEIKNEDFLILFSSGSSGRPKGVKLSQSCLYHQFNYWKNHVGLDENDAVLSALTISHSHGMMLIFPSLLSGSHVHLIQAEQVAPEFVCQYCSENSITMISGIPLLYHLLLNQEEQIDKRLSTLRYAICGSAPMSPTMAEHFHRKYGVHIRQAYGLTETGPVCVNMFENGIYNYQSVGKIIDGYEYKIVDENDKEVSNGEEGELAIKSKANSEGFLNAPEDEAKMFQSDGWLYTQDIVRENENKELTIIGRKTSFINVSGFKVYPAEIEKVLLSFPKVSQVAVVGSADEKLGQVVHAYIVSSSDTNKREIKKHCIDNLSSFKVPKRISIVDELPTNSIGKVKYGELS